MAPEYLGANANQNDTTQYFGPFAQQRADKSPDHNPQRRHHQRRAADSQRGGDNIYLQECQANPDGHRIETGGEGGGDQQPETVAVLRLFIFIFS